MMDAGVGFSPASELVERYRDRSFSPVEVVLRRIEFAFEQARPWADR